MPVVSTNPVRQPKEFKIPSRSFGITPEEAAEMLSTAEEIKMNKPLWDAASKILSKQLLAKRQAQLDATKAAAKGNKA